MQPPPKRLRAPPTPRRSAPRSARCAATRTGCRVATGVSARQRCSSALRPQHRGQRRARRERPDVDGRSRLRRNHSGREQQGVARRTRCNTRPTSPSSLSKCDESLTRATFDPPKSAAGHEAAWNKVPEFSCTVGESTLKYRGWGTGYEHSRLVDHHNGFTVYYESGGELVGVLTLNADDDYRRATTSLVGGTSSTAPSRTPR